MEGGSGRRALPAGRARDAQEWPAATGSAHARGPEGAAGPRDPLGATGPEQSAPPQSALPGADTPGADAVGEDAEAFPLPRRERVRAAFDRLGHRRNPLAHPVSKRRSGILGIVTTTSSNYGPIAALHGIEVAARARGYYAAVAALEGAEPSAVRQAIDHFLGQSVEGIVIIDPLEGAGEDLADVDVPVPVVAVTAAPVAQPSGVISVRLEQEAAARRAVEHLLALGHTDIAHVRGLPTWYSAHAREAGWRSAMGAAGLPVREPAPGAWDAASGYRAARSLLTDVPTAVFAANDDLAIGVIRALVEAGLSVPEDVSVIGFDDLPTAAWVVPPLTTVRQDFTRLGEQVVELLWRADRGEVAIGPVVRPADLIVRSSTAPPRVRGGSVPPG